MRNVFKVLLLSTAFIGAAASVQATTTTGETGTPQAKTSKFTVNYAHAKPSGRAPASDHANASARVIPLSCQPFGGGWQVFGPNGNPIANGNFAQKGDCDTAVQNQRHGFACAAQGGGSAVIDLRTNIAVGNGNYQSLSDCDNVVQTANHGLICGAQNGGTIVYSRYSGILGNGQFSDIASCQNAIANASNNVVCGAQNGGWGMFSVMSGRQLGLGQWSSNSDCFAAAKVVRDGQVCVPEDAQIRIEVLETGVRAGYYSDLTTCQNDL